MGIRTVACVCGYQRKYEWIYKDYINFPRFTDGARECPNCHKYYRPGDLIDMQNSKLLWGTQFVSDKESNAAICGDTEFEWGGEDCYDGQ